MMVHGSPWPRCVGYEFVTIRAYFRVMSKRWRVIVACTMLGLAAAAGITFAMPVTYSAEATAFVAIASSGTDTSTSIYQSSQFALQRVKSYTEVVHSPDVLQPVIDSLRLDESIEELRTTVTAENPVDTVLIKVSVTSSSPAGAQRTANATSDQLGKVIEQLETSREGGTPPVKVTTAVPAALPQFPVSPRRTINLALGILAGLGLGVIGSVLRDQQDTTIKGDDLQVLSGRAPLGLIAYTSEIVGKPLIVLDGVGPAVEEFRSMRTNLQFVDVDNPPQQIVVTSAVASEGKTTLACNLAITLAQSSLHVCLVEADMRRPKVTSYMGIDGTVGLSNLLAGQFEIDEMLVPWHRGLLTVLPAGTPPPDPSKLLGSRNMTVLLSELRRRFDFVIIDAPPVLPVTDAVILAHATDGALFVSRYGHTRRDQVTRALEDLANVKAKLIGTVLTFVPPKGHRELRGHDYGYGYATREREVVELATGAGSPAGPDPTVLARHRSWARSAELDDADERGAESRDGNQPGARTTARS